MDPSATAPTPAVTTPYLVLVMSFLALMPAFVSALATWWSSIGSRQGRSGQALRLTEGWTLGLAGWLHIRPQTSDPAANKEPVIAELNAAAAMMRSVPDEVSRLSKQTSRVRVALAQTKVNPVRRALFLYRMPRTESQVMRLFFYSSCAHYGWEMLKIFGSYKTPSPSSLYGHGSSVAVLFFCLPFRSRTSTGLRWMPCAKVSRSWRYVLTQIFHSVPAPKELRHISF